MEFSSDPDLRPETIRYHGEHENSNARPGTHSDPGGGAAGVRRDQAGPDGGHLRASRRDQGGDQGGPLRRRGGAGARVARPAGGGAAGPGLRAGGQGAGFAGGGHVARRQVPGPRAQRGRRTRPGHQAQAAGPRRSGGGSQPAEPGADPHPEGELRRGLQALPGGAAHPAGRPGTGRPAHRPYAEQPGSLSPGHGQSGRCAGALSGSAGDLEGFGGGRSTCAPPS